MRTVSVRLYGNLGDSIYCFAGIRQYCWDNNAKAVLYVALDIPAFYMPGAQHETVDDSGTMVMMARPQFEMFEPLVLSQSWVVDYRVWKGEKVDLDLTELHHRNVNMPYGNIARWASYLYPNLATDLSKPWLEIEKDDDIKKEFGDKFLICRTARYNNPHISYYFLREYQQHKLLFVGTEKENEDFNKKWGLKIQYLKVPTFLHLAQVVKSAKGLLANQTFIFALAEAMKTPRILEVFPPAPNVIPCGENAYDFLHQGALQYYFSLLNSDK